eukprot:gene31696-35712_t
MVRQIVMMQCEWPGVCRKEICRFAYEKTPGRWSDGCPAQPQWIQCAAKNWPCKCNTKVRYGSPQGTWSELNMTSGKIDCRDDKFPNGYSGPNRVCECWTECSDAQRWARDGWGCAYAGRPYSGTCTSGVCNQVSCLDDDSKCADLGNDCCASGQPGDSDGPGCSENYR